MNILQLLLFLLLSLNLVVNSRQQCECLDCKSSQYDGKNNNHNINNNNNQNENLIITVEYYQTDNNIDTTELSDEITEKWYNLTNCDQNCMVMQQGSEICMHEPQTQFYSLSKIKCLLNAQQLENTINYNMECIEEYFEDLVSVNVRIDPQYNSLDIAKKKNAWCKSENSSALLPCCQKNFEKICSEYITTEVISLKEFDLELPMNEEISDKEVLLQIDMDQNPKLKSAPTILTFQRQNSLGQVETITSILTPAATPTPTPSVNPFINFVISLTPGKNTTKITFINHNLDKAAPLTPTPVIKSALNPFTDIPYNFTILEEDIDGQFPQGEIVMPSSDYTPTPTPGPGLTPTPTPDLTPSRTPTPNVTTLILDSAHNESSRSNVLSLVFYIVVVLLGVAMLSAIVVYRRGIQRMAQNTSESEIENAEDSRRLIKLARESS